ncbi:hypothetical protein [Labilibaculum antarcticum]|uniref:Uncharacterized protein n=1 Tax=Labilibaculum antarcticum TaxID=1717717 RepID=A0A1Y1CNI0_9BACT|nr:hypothetical protein [Labilibaculum antarcticum]BAX81976.1 hypothetical protein ALGA_3684 [Labilibaculum antarcticum]
MSDQQNLLDLLEEIKAVTEEAIVYCDMPYQVYINEAEGLHSRASLDIASLVKYNMEPNSLNRLLACTGALRTAQSNWQSQKTDKKKAREAWDAEAPELFRFRDELADHLAFALRNKPTELEIVKKIKEGTSRSDAIQDLADLAVLGRENAPALTAISYDLSLLDKATGMADYFGGLLGELNGHMYFEDDIKLVRDKAYTLTKEIVDEVRSYGKFVFRNNPVKREAYTSKYSRERMAAYRNQPETEEIINETTIEN